MRNQGVQIYIVSFLWLLLSSLGKCFTSPVADPAVTQHYADEHPDSGELHAGIDLIPNSGDYDIVAAFPGDAIAIPIGTFSNENHGLGNVVVVDSSDEGLPSTVYAHLESIAVENGQTLNEGDPIGIMGNTGESNGRHLHFEVKPWPVLGNLDDDDGPQWGYTPGNPNLYGYENPFPYFEFDIRAIEGTIVRSSEGQPIRTGPSVDYVETFGSVSGGDEFVAKRKFGDWYLVDLPSFDGPASGWINGQDSASTRLVEVDDPARGTVGVSLRGGPSLSSERVSFIWDDQLFVLESETPGSDWVEIALANSTTGWVSRRYAMIHVDGGGGGGGSANLRVASFEIEDDDGGGSSGNDDGGADAGEEIEIDVTLENTGGGQATDPELSATEGSPYATLTDDSLGFDVISAGASARASDLDLQIDSDAPSGHRITISVEITAPEGSWTDSFTVEVDGSGGGGGGSANLQVDTFEIDDDNNDGSSGNDDGDADAGEDIEINVTLENTGGSRATDPELSATEDSPYATLTDDDFGFGVIPAGGSFSAGDLNLEIDGDAPSGHRITISVEITAQEGSWTDSFSFEVDSSGGGSTGTTYAANQVAGPVDEDTGSTSIRISRTGDLPSETVFVSTTVVLATPNSEDFEDLRDKPVSFTSGQSETTIMIRLIDDIIPEDDETFFISIHKSPGRLPIVNFQQSFTVTDADQLDYDIWSEEIPERLRGPEGSLFEGGSVNLIRYSLGLGPNEPATKQVQPRANITSSREGSRIELSFRRPIYIEDIEYTVETSPDMVNWGAAEFAREDLIDPNFTMRTFYSRPESSESESLFIRLRVERK